MAVKQLGPKESQKFALRERKAMEAVQAKKYTLPFYGLYEAGSASPDAIAGDEVRNGRDAFFVMG